MAWTLLEIGNEHNQYSNYKEFMIDSADDIESPPSESYAPGSIAYTAGYGKMYMADNSGEWHEIGGD